MATATAAREPATTNLMLSLLRKRCEPVLLEEVAHLEVELPARRRIPAGVLLVEAISKVHADRPEGRDQGHAEPGAPEQPGRVPLARRPVDVAVVHERAHVERLADPGTCLHGEGRVGLAEGVRVGPAAPGLGVEAVRGDGELLVA